MATWKRVSVITGSALLIAAMISTWVWGDLNAAGQVASVIGAAIGTFGICYTVLSRDSRSSLAISVSNTGKSFSRLSGGANTGLIAPSQARGSMTVQGTGDAEADGGAANSGIDLR